MELEELLKIKEFLESLENPNERSLDISKMYIPPDGPDIDGENFYGFKLYGIIPIQKVKAESE